MSDFSFRRRFPPGLGVGPGDIVSALARLAARQKASPTACAMRDWDGCDAPGDSPAERIVLLFRRGGGGVRPGVSGPFNDRIARQLAGKQSEQDVYRGT